MANMKDISYIKLKDLTKTYQIGEKTFQALDDIDLEIPQGEFVVILGPSGAGKTTLLNLLGGMDSPSCGDVIIDGENIANYKKTALAEYRAENVGFIFQFYNILPTLTALENVEIVNDIVKAPKSARKILKEVGLGEHLHKFPSQLSGGEQQRVAIARAIAKNPKLLLCDEPTGALDSKTGVEVLALLKAQCDADSGHNTVIVVTHNALIADIADRVIYLKNGQIAKVKINKRPKRLDQVEW